MTRPLTFAIALLGIATAQSQPVHTPAIVIDDAFGDWDRIEVGADDPADAPSSPVDFRNVRVTADGQFIYVQLDCAKTIGIQALPVGTIWLLVDQDNNPATGQTVKGAAGIDLAMELGQGAVIRKYATTPAAPVNVSVAESGFLFSPRFASSRFEFRVDRGASRQAGIKFVYDQAGTIRDETVSIRVELPALESLQAPGPNDRIPALDPLRRADGETLRVAIWNVSGFPKTDRGRYLRMLRAINADIVMLDEADPRKSAVEVAQWFNTMVADAGSGWHAIVGKAYQGTIVAARGALTPAFDRADYPRGSIEPFIAGYSPDARARVRASIEESGVGTTGALAIIGGRRVLSVPVDLTSGGALTSGDAQRVMEATAIATAARRAVIGTRPDAIVVGGDFNLMGARDPLDTLLNGGLDVDRSSLADVRAIKLDGRSNATWRNLGGGRFSPGRLDWLLYSDSSLTQVGGFVFDTADLSPYWLALHHLFKNDSEYASDHLPVVADFRWKR
jgi:endonuclease/exonuclease/phosphatase family metal-dependent hydrolase